MFRHINNWNIVACDVINRSHLLPYSEQWIYIFFIYSTMMHICVLLTTIALSAFTIGEVHIDSKLNCNRDEISLESILICIDAYKMGTNASSLQDTLKQSLTKRITLATNPVLIRFAQRRQNRRRKIKMLWASYMHARLLKHREYKTS